MRKFDPRKMTLPTVDVRKTVAPAAKVARDAAYVAVGLGVIATQKATARRYDIEQRVKEVAPRVRDEAKATAERDVLVVQLEGGELSSEDVQEGLSTLGGAILESRRYATLYDLTLQDFEAGALLPHAPSLLSFAGQ
ncbi:MAG: hypothetical protein EBX15_01200, partial [Acidimicrobiia bacterium]|nr:hypothetical protein [Acidimicrobiia bacterium]